MEGCLIDKQMWTILIVYSNKVD